MASTRVAAGVLLLLTSAAFPKVANAEERATEWSAELVLLARQPDCTRALALVTCDRGCMASVMIGARVLKRAVEAALGPPT